MFLLSIRIICYRPTDSKRYGKGSINNKNATRKINSTPCNSQNWINEITSSEGPRSTHRSAWYNWVQIGHWIHSSTAKYSSSQWLQMLSWEISVVLCPHCSLYFRVKKGYKSSLKIIKFVYKRLFTNSPPSLAWPCKSSRLLVLGLPLRLLQVFSTTVLL